MRSLLFVPAHEAKKLNKALGCNADAMIIDLEDAVPEFEKTNARSMCYDFLNEHQRGSKLVVRINALTSSHALEDLKVVIKARPWGVMLPKCESVQDVIALDKQLDELERTYSLESNSTKIFPIVTETAQSIFGLSTYVNYRGNRLSGMLWGGEDLAADVGSLTNRDQTQSYTSPYLLARSLTLFAASSANALAIDAVYTNYRDMEGLKDEALAALRDGFSAKAAIHPDQVAVINEVFTPSAEDLQKAAEIVATFKKTPNAGAVAIEGKMLDLPHLKSAQRLLQRAQINVQ
jgi:citrate lyase subunit beta/citryl-CoA lyase